MRDQQTNNAFENGRVRPSGRTPFNTNVRGNMLRIAIYTVCALLCSCASTGVPVNNYGYVFHETTGITRAVLVDGHEVKIKFSSDSDKIALDTLTSLHWTVLYPNSNGKHIFVRGQLDRITQMTPDRPDMADAEPFNEFRLISWYITTPFIRLKESEEWVPEDDYEVELSHNLSPDDFTKKEIVNGVTLSGFQRNGP